MGPSRNLKEGLPQVSVLSPLFFTIYMSDLLAEFERDTFVSAYADDLLIARSAYNKDMILASLLLEVCKVVDWSDKARLTLNISNCDTAFFSLDCAEATKHHHWWKMFCNPFLVFLDVRYDRQLTFAKHVRKLCQ